MSAEPAEEWGTPPVEASPDAGKPDAPVGPSNVVALPTPAPAELVELDDDDASSSTVQPVEAPAMPKTLERYIDDVRAARLEPIIPPYLHTLRGWWEVTRWLARYYWHYLAFYGVRGPLFVGMVLFGLAPRGFMRSLRALDRWVTDEETGVLQRAQACDNKNAEMHIKLTRQRDAHTRWRWCLVVAGVVVVVVTLAVLAQTRPPWWHPRLAELAFVLTLARIGKTPGTPMLGRAVIKFETPKLTAQVIDVALAALGIAQLTAAFNVKAGGTGVQYPAPIMRTRTGYCAQIDLPHGVAAEEVVDRRVKLAAGLRRPVGAVWPMLDPDPEQHAGRLVLHVTDRPFSKMPQSPWPLARAGHADLFKPVPLGFDQRGELVEILLVFTNMLIGAIPRMGKTMALRVLLLAAALDPRVELHVHELKGTGDLRALQPSAHRYASGPSDKSTLERVMASIREVHGYLAPRAAAISRLPRHLCPENKVTPALAARRDLGLHLVVLAIDEVQELFESEYRAEAETLLKAIIKRGPALGIILLVATQKPEKDSLPTSISSNVGTRLALRVMDWAANDMILGTGAHKAGIKATLLQNTDKGIGYLRDGADAILVRSAQIDAVAADKIGARAALVRADLDLLTGDAAGSGPAVTVSVNIVDDVRSVFAGDETALWSTIIIERLAALRPELYAGWKQAQLTAALKAKGVDAGRQVERMDEAKGKRVNARGVYLEDLPAAITAGPSAGAGEVSSER